MFWSPSCVTPHLFLHPPLWLALSSHPRLQHILETWAMLMRRISDNNPFGHTPSSNLWLLHVPGRDTGSITRGKSPSSTEHHFNIPTKRKGFSRQLPLLLCFKVIWPDRSQDKGPSEDILTKNLCLEKQMHLKKSISQLSMSLSLYQYKYITTYQAGFLTAFPSPQPLTVLPGRQLLPQQF